MSDSMNMCASSFPWQSRVDTAFEGDSAMFSGMQILHDLAALRVGRIGYVPRSVTCFCQARS